RADSARAQRDKRDCMVVVSFVAGQGQGVATVPGARVCSTICGFARMAGPRVTVGLCRHRISKRRHLPLGPAAHALPVTRPSSPMSAFLEERVLSVHHWTDRLFSFTTTRDPALRFSNGHFTMIGLKVDGKPLLRAYSIVSANYEEHLEFLSIKVPDGPLTSRLQDIQVGDSIIVGKKPTGTLLI